MNDSRCPNCQNDLTESVHFAIVAMVDAGASGVADVQCPHCGETLEVYVKISTAIVRHQEALAS